jgi:hypothetical protein
MQDASEIKLRRRLMNKILIVALSFITWLPINERAKAANDAYCLGMTGEEVRNICAHAVVVAWRDGGWRVWHFEPGDTQTLPGLVRSVDSYACDARRGGIKYSNGEPVGCR